MGCWSEAAHIKRSVTFAPNHYGGNMNKTQKIGAAIVASLALVTGSTIGTVISLDDGSDTQHVIMYEATITYDIDYEQLQQQEPFMAYMMPGSVSGYQDIFKITDSGSSPALPVGSDIPMGPGDTFDFRAYATNHTDFWMYGVDGYIEGLTAGDNVWIDGGPVDLAPHSEAEFWFHIEVSDTAIDAPRAIKVLFTREL